VPTLHLIAGSSASNRRKQFDAGAGDGALSMMLVPHGDAQREYAYAPAQGLPDTKVDNPYTGVLRPSQEERLDSHQYEERLSMKNNWRRIFVLDRGGDVA
jgi:hypothetical protein